MVVKQGRGIQVILSRGPEMVNVPHVEGLTRRQASILVERNFLQVENVLTTGDADVARGRVVQVDPPPGTLLPKGSQVVLTVSEGAQKVRVPSLIDLTVEQARETLEEEGLQIGEVTFRFNRYLPAGKIIDQHPLERTPVERGGKVDVVVSSSRQ
jgi:serine/threonine-protein kinase